MSASISRLIEALADEVNRNAVLRRLGRFCSTEMLLEIGDADFHLVFDHGRLEAVIRGPSTRSTGSAAPVYLLTGEYDYSCTPQSTRATAERIPGAKAIIMRRIGHFPMSENPALFREYLLPVLEEIKARTDADR